MANLNIEAGGNIHSGGKTDITKIDYSEGHPHGIDMKDHSNKYKIINFFGSKK
jgi:hypothetical protein